MILLFTIGFDIKFQLRVLAKRAKDVEKVALIGEFNNEREKALDLNQNEK